MAHSGPSGRNLQCLAALRRLRQMGAGTAPELAGDGAAAVSLLMQCGQRQAFFRLQMRVAFSHVCKIPGKGFCTQGSGPGRKNALFHILIFPLELTHCGYMGVGAGDCGRVPLVCGRALVETLPCLLFALDAPVFLLGQICRQSFTLPCQALLFLISLKLCSLPVLLLPLLHVALLPQCFLMVLLNFCNGLLLAFGHTDRRISHDGNDQVLHQCKARENGSHGNCSVQQQGAQHALKYAAAGFLPAARHVLLPCVKRHA